jgi:hypothetical protein
MTIWFSRRARPGKSSIRAGGRDTLMVVAARKGIPVSLSVRGVEEVRDALKKGARLASVGTLKTVLYQALRGWRQNVTK